MKRKFALVWVMVLAGLACRLPATVQMPQATVMASPSSTATITPTPYPPILKQPIQPGQEISNLTYCTNTVALKMDVYFPLTTGGPTPALLYIHGGGWIGGDKDKSLGLDDIPALTEAGYLVAVVEYRRSVKYPFPAMVTDVKCAVRFLRARAAEFNIQPNRIGAWGSSAGGHIAALVGLTDESAGWDVGEYSEYSSRLQAVVDMFGPTDLNDPAYQEKFERKGYLLFDVAAPSPELLAAASPISHVSADDPPFLIIHGDEDTVVKLQQSELLYQRLVSFGVPAELLIVKHAQHNLVPMGDVMIPTREEITQLMVEFFNSILKAVP